MRHGASRRAAGQNGAACTMALSEDGRDAVSDVAHGLADTLNGLTGSHNISVHVVVHGTSDLATQTAHAVHEELTRYGQFEGDHVSAPVFNGQHASPWSGDLYQEEEEEASKLIDKQLAKAGSGRP
jgi:hypothetical protein